MAEGQVAVVETSEILQDNVDAVRYEQILLKHDQIDSEHTERPAQLTLSSGTSEGASGVTPVNEPSSEDDILMTATGSSAQEKPPHNTKLYIAIKQTQWPIIYTPEYNISFLGLEKVHPFDAGKWGKVHSFLKEAGMICDGSTVKPAEAQEEDLLVVHSKQYLSELTLADFVEGYPEWSYKVAVITEVPPVALLPNFVVQKKVLRPFRYHTGGTILAAKVAVDRGWAINIGGGFHHCSADRGGGFCAYADITLAIKFLMEREIIKKAMIIDLDAHQGNGHERDFMNNPNVYILDIYNRGIYPHDGYAKRAIRRKVELQFYTEDEEYLQKVNTNVEGALNEFTPDLVIYNAGTDILDGDPLGCLSISPQGIIERDQLVFEKCKSRKIPVAMVTSGGYQKTTARIIANSILNLHGLDLIRWDQAEHAPPAVEEAMEARPGMTRSASDGRLSLWDRFKSSCSGLTRSSTQAQLEPS